MTGIAANERQLTHAFRGRAGQLRQPLFSLVRTALSAFGGFPRGEGKKSQWANRVSIVLFSANTEERLAFMASLTSATSISLKPGRSVTPGNMSGRLASKPLSRSHRELPEYALCRRFGTFCSRPSWTRLRIGYPHVHFRTFLASPAGLWECPLVARSRHQTRSGQRRLLTQSGHFTQNPPNIRPNIPGAGAGAGDGRVGGTAVIVPLDRKATGGFWATLDGGGPAFLSRTTPGIGDGGPAWPNSSCVSPSGALGGDRTQRILAWA